MAMIKNASPGLRIFNAKVGKDGSELVTLAPGEEREVEVLDTEDPVFKGMVESGDLVMDGEEMDQEEAQQARFANDPKFLADRALAEEAPKRGLADPFPEDAEVQMPGEEGEESDDGSEEGGARKGGRRRASKKRRG